MWSSEWRGLTRGTVTSPKAFRWHRLSGCLSRVWCARGWGTQGGQAGGGRGSEGGMRAEEWGSGRDEGLQSRCEHRERTRILRHTQELGEVTVSPREAGRTEGDGARRGLHIQRREWGLGGKTQLRGWGGRGGSLWGGWVPTVTAAQGGGGGWHQNKALGSSPAHSSFSADRLGANYL